VPSALSSVFSVPNFLLLHLRETLNNHSTFKSLAVAGLLACSSLVSVAADQAGDWYYDLSIYGLAAGMSGDITIGSVTADANLPFDTILENLELAAMGSIRVGRGNWAMTLDVVYMGLGASKNGVTVDMDELFVEPTVSYRLNERVELLAGGRMTDIAVTLRGPGIFPGSDTREADEAWWDAIVGANITLRFAQDWAFTLRADIGTGGSNLTWQALPGVSWTFSPKAELQFGYRWLYCDYETNSGARYFHYDMLDQGAQVGVRFHF
jgi:opacity protein-like surface antigen